MATVPQPKPVRCGRHARVAGVACGALLAACASSGGGAGAGGGGGNGGTTPASLGGSNGSGGAAAAAGGGGVAAPTGGIFQAPEPWTKDVSGLTKDARSDAIIAALSSLGGWGAGAMKVDFSIPLFFGDAATPRRTITAQPGNDYCYGGPDCDPVPLQMPIPASGNAEGSNDYTCDVTYNTDGQGDCHVLVVARDENRLYELYNATQSGSAFIALGAFIWDLTKAYPDNLRGDQCTSADAGGFPIAGLLATADEAATGTVPHALRFILPNARMKAGVYVHPGTHAGSPSSSNDNAPPYGVRLRLKPTFDETPYSAGERAILGAMKTYGMLLSDGGNIALTFADDRTSTAKWDALGVTSQSFTALTVDDFEVVDLGAEIALTDDCVRNP